MTRYPRFARIHLCRYPRQFPRTRRIQPNVGFFIPTEGDVTEALSFGKALVARALSKVTAICSCLNTRDQFEGMVVDVFCRCLDRYRAFTSKAEFLKITRTAMRNRVLDNFRNMFRQKRWGFEVEFVEESDDDRVSTIASINRHTVCLSNSADLVTQFSTDDLDLQELLLQFQQTLSPEAYRLLLSLFHEECNIEECKNTPPYLELLESLKTLALKGVFSSPYFQTRLLHSLA